MFIEEVIIDGFKSYSTKVTVGPFDKQFNAITGLNGTGKSNILDSICFVLGISNLSQVRVDSLNQLVYKNGQAGVTKAVVTVTFNNLDKSVSPMGYEKYDEIKICRQIVIGGRNRYSINGHNVQGTQIANLFHSVQLNVNNPHFLIMQGRITKVINMKPAETLSMIEEAAGTRMYEAKKNNAKKMMEKKQVKVDEINRVLSEDIGPTLEKLAAERQNYMQWTSNQNEIDRLVRFCIAGDYLQWIQRLENRNAEKHELDAEMEKLAQDEEEQTQLQQEVEKAIAEAKDQRASGDLASVEAEHKKANKELASIESRAANRRKNVQSETANQSKEVELYKKLQGEIEEHKALKAKEAAILEEREKVFTSQQEELQKTARTLEAVKAGMNQAEDGAKSIKEELMDTKSRLATLAEEEKKTKETASVLVQRLQAAEAQLKTCNTAGVRLAQETEHTEAQVKELEKNLEKVQFSDETYWELDKLKNIRYKEQQELRDRYDALKRSLQQCEFEYDDPTTKFDRSRVKGKVVSLFSVKKDWIPYASALEVVAGGKMFHVVVDNEETGKLVLSKGNLKRRVTIIPLNRIVDNSMSPNVVQMAKQVAKEGEAFPALEIVGFPRELERAMKFVFGSTLICDNSDTAKRVAFHPQVRTKCVTKLGDVYDPAGIVTGGANARQNPILEMMAQLSVVKLDMDAAEKALEQAEKNLHQANEKWTLRDEAQRQLQYKQHQYSLLLERSGKSEYARIANEVKEMKKKKQEGEEYIKNFPELLKATQKKVKELEHEIANFDKTKDSKQAALTQKIAELKKAVKESEKHAKTQKEVVENMDMRLETMEQECTSAHEAQENKGKKFEELQKEVQDLETQQKTLSETVTALAAKKEELKADMKHLEVVLRDKTKELEKIKKLRENCEVERRKLKHKMERFKKDGQEAGEVIKSLEKKNPWIETEKKFFGKPGTDFDFDKTGLSQAKKKLTTLESDNVKLGRNLNKKVMNMYDKAHEDYQDLVAKRDTIWKDKEKILSVIDDLDQRKKEAVIRTWNKVNVDFGSIFGTLLPGTDAKLEPPPNMQTETEITGLEIKVAFTGIWKQSLSELSGGQRSLLALSLVLALLRFKPAPMYILDEVDAALDLSHTQNIGMMIKQHFPNSQFIIVSLKKGMFDNANVLFETAFVDGCSRVSRTVQGTSAPPKNISRKRKRADDDDGELERIAVEGV